MQVVTAGKDFFIALTVGNLTVTGTGGSAKEAAHCADVRMLEKLKNYLQHRPEDVREIIMPTDIPPPPYPTVECVIKAFCSILTDRCNCNFAVRSFVRSNVLATRNSCEQMAWRRCAILSINYAN